MALDFSFKSQFPVAQMVQIMQQKAVQQQQMDLAQQQAKRDQFNQLLNSLSAGASIARNMQGIKSDALANQMATSKMQGTQDLGQLLSNANAPYQGPMMPISQPLGQGMQGPDASMVPQSNPMFGQTPGYQDQLRSALFKASPDIVASQIAKQQYGDPEMAAIKKQNVLYDQQIKQGTIAEKTAGLSTTGNNVDALKAAIKTQAPDFQIPDNISFAQLDKISKDLAAGDRGSAFKEMVQVRKANYMTSGIEPQLKLEESRLVQGTHLLNLADQAYDPKTDTYDVKKLMVPEFNMGLARMFNPNGIVGVEAQNQINQATAKGDFAKVYQYVTGDTSSDLSNALPQDIAKLMVKAIDRQAEQAQQNRDTFQANKSEAIGMDLSGQGINYKNAKAQSKIFGGQKGGAVDLSKFWRK